MRTALLSNLTALDDENMSGRRGSDTTSSSHYRRRLSEAYSAERMLHMYLVSTYTCRSSCTFITGTICDSSCAALHRGS